MDAKETADLAACEDDSFNGGELHLFILWQNARTKEKDILIDIKKHFKILNVYDVEWNDGLFSENLTRFYGKNLPNGSSKEIHCGKGNFLLIVFLDKKPSYSKRRTSKGRKIVNENVFDAKKRYREWTGGGHKVHGTNSLLETKHDLALLLGADAVLYFNGKHKEWHGKVEPLKRDLIGSNGYENISVFFEILNNTMEYVVLRNFDCLPDEYNMKNHGDIDLLVSNYHDAKRISNSEEVFPLKKYRVHNSVKIAGKNVLFDFRYVKDDYYDKRWEKAILDERIFHEHGFYVPSLKNHFYSLLYHAFVHKRRVSPDYVWKLLEMAQHIGIKNVNKKTFQDKHKSRELLDLFMKRKGYAYAKPKDLSVKRRFSA